MSGIYENISVICFCVSGLFAAVSVFVWFKFGIHKVIRSLMGYRKSDSSKGFERKKKNEENIVYSANYVGNTGTDKLVTASTEKNNEDTILLNEGTTILNDETMLLNEDNEANEEKNFEEPSRNNFRIVESVEFASSDKEV